MILLWPDIWVLAIARFTILKRLHSFCNVCAISDFLFPIFFGFFFQKICNRLSSCGNKRPCPWLNNTVGDGLLEELKKKVCTEDVGAGLAVLVFILRKYCNARSFYHFLFEWSASLRWASLLWSCQLPSELWRDFWCRVSPGKQEVFCADQPKGYWPTIFGNAGTWGGHSRTQCELLNWNCSIVHGILCCLQPFTMPHVHFLTSQMW